MIYFPAPVFSSRVLRARLLIELWGNVSCGMTASKNLCRKELTKESVVELLVALTRKQMSYRQTEHA
jgi:hypothetical protein